MKKTHNKSGNKTTKKVELRINKKSILSLSAIIPIAMIIIGIVIFLWGAYDLISDNEKSEESNMTGNIELSEVAPTGDILDEGVSVKDGEETNNQGNTALENNSDGNSLGTDLINNIEKGLRKSLANQERMKNEGRWIATDYVYGDIQTKSYTVQLGDTLWEIAEASYGNGSMWLNILNANSSSIGFLSNGSQALIIPGQVLVIP
jgi:nucleoid-associated protein YgaU